MDVEKAMAVELAGRLQRGLTGRDTEQMIREVCRQPGGLSGLSPGPHYLKQRTADGYTRSIGYFEQAIAKDPTYAPAYAGLAETFAIAAYFDMLPAISRIRKPGGGPPRPRTRRPARRGACGARGSALVLRMEFSERRAALQGRPRSDPNFASAIMGYSCPARLSGSVSAKRSPRPGGQSSSTRCRLASWSHRMALLLRPPVRPRAGAGAEDARAESELRHLVLPPGPVEPRQGARADEMREIIERYKIDPLIADAQLAYVEAVRGDEQREAGLPRVTEAAAAGTRRSPAYGVASIYAALGYRAEALEWLEKAYALREGSLTWLSINS